MGIAKFCVQYITNSLINPNTYPSRYTTVMCNSRATIAQICCDTCDLWETAACSWAAADPCRSQKLIQLQPAELFNLQHRQGDTVRPSRWTFCTYVELEVYEGCRGCRWKIATRWPRWPNVKWEKCVLICNNQVVPSCCSYKVKVSVAVIISMFLWFDFYDFYDFMFL